ncbi:MAG: VWA domain-containing protein [Deltaproteobacteria bacterium]|nr:VWA domain-containing protein [Deltaproteobacteria bacterium]
MFSSRAILGSVLGSGLVLLACAGDARAPFEATPPLEDDPPFVPGSSTGGPIADDAKCAGAFVTLARAPLYMLFIVDGSGSMMDPLVPGGPTGLKWAAARDALVSFFGAMGAQKDYTFAAGLFLFDGTKGVPDFTQVDVPIHYVDATQRSLLEKRIVNATPQGGTPLKRALEGQIPFIESFVPSAPLASGGKRVVVVISDGVPDGGADVQPIVQQQCIDLVDAARKGPAAVTTFAVGVGDPSSSTSTYDEVFVGKLATAGGAARAGCTPGWSEASPAGQTPCHFQVTPGTKTAAQIKDELLGALDAIRGAAQGCELALVQPDGSPGVPDPSKVNVVFTDANGNESAVAKDASNGWSYDDPSRPTKVVFNGEACRRLQSVSNGKVKVELGCATRVQ